MKLIAQQLVDGTMCDAIELIPKRKSPYLLKGRMWVNASDMMLVKIEGQPPTSASFFEGRPEIVREYKQIHGFSLAQHNHAVSSKFLVGQSTVDIGDSSAGEPIVVWLLPPIAPGAENSIAR
jgi:hypothetical protein